jgi:hypothetical protein
MSSIEVSLVLLIFIVLLTSNSCKMNANNDIPILAVDDCTTPSYVPEKSHHLPTRSELKKITTPLSVVRTNISILNQ